MKTFIYVFWSFFLSLLMICVSSVNPCYCEENKLSLYECDAYQSMIKLSKNLVTYKMSMQRQNEVFSAFEDMLMRDATVIALEMLTHPKSQPEIDMLVKRVKAMAKEEVKTTVFNYVREEIAKSKPGTFVQKLPSLSYVRPLPSEISKVENGDLLNFYSEFIIAMFADNLVAMGGITRAEIMKLTDDQIRVKHDSLIRQHGCSSEV